MRITALARGEPVEAIDTPALVIDLDAMEKNLAAMAAFARGHGVRLRPHAKMHKSAAIARLQMAAGAVGVCVQKTSEAEALADAGIDDLYISNEVIDNGKLARVAALAARVRLAIAVDSLVGVERLAAAMARSGATIEVFVEVDVGQGRCGIAPAAAAQHVRSVAEREAAAHRAAARARAAQAAIGALGIACRLVTGAGTGTFRFDVASGVWGEVQAGSYLFMDRDYADNDADASAPRFEHALFVKSRVISRGAAHAVIDAGHKSHAIDSGPPRLWQRPGTWASGGDEHGIVRPPPGGGPAELPALGETVWLVPGHCDPTVNLHDRYVCVRGGLASGVVEAVWPIEARGCVA
jgi:D-serine deaminase-like pyridoxal phosphate-dependent protein